MSMKGKKGLVVGLANEKSIAWGCARAFFDSHADLAITYQNEKTLNHIHHLIEHIKPPILQPLDITQDDQLESLFETISKKWGKLDFLLHSIAFAPKEDLHGRLVDCSLNGFNMAMDISCHSLIRLAHYAEPLMKEGGSILTMTYYGGQKVINNYGLMGPVKAALEASVKYLAKELAHQKIRVNALSPGPLPTRAANGLHKFDELLETTHHRTPLKDTLSIEQVGEMAAFLSSDKAKHITGQVIHIDNGYSIMG